MSILNAYAIELRSPLKFLHIEESKVSTHSMTFIMLQLVTTLQYIYFFTFGFIKCTNTLENPDLSDVLF